MELHSLIAAVRVEGRRSVDLAASLGRSGGDKRNIAGLLLCGAFGIEGLSAIQVSTSKKRAFGRFLGMSGV